MTPKLFSELGLSPEILKAIDKLGFEQASPIQAEAIPVLLAGKDIVGQSQTGSGKTAAFAIPAIEKTDPALKAVQVLVLCPTRELAVQVSEEVHKLALFKRGILALPIYGGQSYERQFHGLKQGAQIVIGTPGRVMDHLDRGTLRLDQLKMIILDEADVMLDMGFREDIEKILSGMPAERQTVFFSATMPKPIKRLIEQFAREPQSVSIAHKTLTVPTVEQIYYEIDRRFKIELLTRLIDLHDLKLGIIFCNTKRMVDELVEHLEAQGYEADRLHGDMNQAQRDRVMNRFRKSGLEFLVATDVAARGIDVDDVEVVFNYDLPYDAEDYVHRIGRTGRAGRSGRAISFASGREIFQIRNIERYTNLRIPRGRVPTLEEVDLARDNQVIAKVRATLQAGSFQQQNGLIERLLEDGYASTDLAAALLHMLLEGDEASARDTPATARKPASVLPPTPGTDQTVPSASEPATPPQVAPAVEASAAGTEQRDRPVPPSVGQEKRPPSRNSPNIQERPPRGEFRAPDRADPRAERRPFRDDRSERSYPRDDRGPGPRERYERGPRTDDRRTDRPRAGRELEPRREGTLRRDDRSYRGGEGGSEENVVAPEPRDFAPMPPLARMKKAAVPPTPAAPTDVPAKSPVEKAAKTDSTAGNTRLHMNVGEAVGLGAADVVNAIMGETGLPARIISKVDLREKHLFVDVAAEHANAIITKLNRAGIAGRKVKVKLA